MAEEAFLCASLFLVAARASKSGIELILFERVEQRNGLQLVSRCVVAFLLNHSALVYTLLHRADNQFNAKAFNQLVSELDGLYKVVTGVYVQKRERYGCRIERLVCKVSHNNRILTSRKQQYRLLELSSNLADYEYRLGL